MRYYVIAGEASGDLHASALVRELKALDPRAVFRGWGGDLMAQEGVGLVKHYRDLAFMGFAEVVKHLPVILKNFRFCEQDLQTFRPDVLILVDYPGFNLRMARFAHRNGIRVFYYISPQLWAWHSSRVKGIRRNVDRMFVILPFEKEFYARHGVEVDYVGHPLADRLGSAHEFSTRAAFLETNNIPDKPILALLPGSRRMEIGQMLRVMTSVRSSFPGLQPVVAAVPSLPASFYEGLLRDTGIPVVTGQTYNLLAHARAALVTSGTATLETALIGTPQVVCYRGNPLSYAIARRLVKVRFISLVNLVCGREVVPELIQEELNTANLVDRLKDIAGEGPVREAILNGYRELKEKLGTGGASALAARRMVQYLSDSAV